MGYKLKHIQELLSVLRKQAPQLKVKARIGTTFLLNSLRKEKDTTEG